MNHPIPKKWLEPFRLSAELSALDYEAAFTLCLPRRTALNRLNRLREVGCVDRHGETRATVYHLIDLGRAKLKADQTSHPSGKESQLGARLSTAAEKLRKKLRRPASERPPVFYQRPFLDSYRSNRIYHLSEPARRKLFEIGSQTGMAEEPAGTYARYICQRLLIELFWNSSHLEGNTYSLLETEQFFQADGSGGVGAVGVLISTCFVSGLRALGDPAVSNIAVAETQLTLVRINLLQYQDCDTASENDHSRNDTGVVATRLLNNGFHTAHHLHLWLHQSLLPDFNRHRAVPRIDPALDHRTFLGLLIERLRRPPSPTRMKRPPSATCARSMSKPSPAARKPRSRPEVTRPTSREILSTDRYSIRP